jgi:hypothetical protein
VESWQSQAGVRQESEVEIVIESIIRLAPGFDCEFFAEPVRAAAQWEVTGWNGCAETTGNLPPDEASRHASTSAHWAFSVFPIYDLHSFDLHSFLTPSKLKVTEILSPT